MTTKQVVYMLLAMLVAAAVSFASTPMVKTLACKVGAIDVPKDNRRMHKVPIPRMGGLAIFLAFLLSVLVFADIDRQMQGILLGSIMIVILGVLDDIMPPQASLSGTAAQFSLSPTPTSFPRQPISISAGCPSPSPSSGSSLSPTPSILSTASTASPSVCLPSRPRP